MLASFGAARRRRGANGHVFNLGHGISQHTPPENVAALVDAVHALSPPYHGAGSVTEVTNRRDRDVVRVSERSGLDLSP